MPEVAPPVLVATSGPVTARRAGKVADGIVTVGTSFDRAATLVERFEQGARESGRDPATMLKIMHLPLRLGAHAGRGHEPCPRAVAARCDALPQGRHPQPARVRADGTPGAPRRLRRPDAHQ
ncbi:LLM class flavin-dependent oxidoreductase [Aeromicrobium sp. UC242_57]|uniref:LLM class flavin-dependent oxidoreductase n=1 Tax=Aeromicrobium sp. UC242_57 TaxID=3374624 RepID=UPI0037BF2F06